MSEGFWRPAPPAENAVLAALRAQAGVRLPASYFDQLAISNGGEGELGTKPGWISFWPADEVINRNEGYRIAADLPGFFGFASNGGSELIAFDVRGGEPFPIVMVPFIPMEVRHVVQISGSFDALRRLIGRAFDDEA